MLCSKLLAIYIIKVIKENNLKKYEIFKGEWQDVADSNSVYLSVTTEDHPIDKLGVEFSIDKIDTSFKREFLPDSGSQQISAHYVLSRFARPVFYNGNREQKIVVQLVGQSNSTLI